MITDHVYRRTTLAFTSRPTDECAYAGCGQPPDAHERWVRDSGPDVCGHCHGPLRGYGAIGRVLLCHPDDGMDCYRLVTLYGHGIDCLSCIHHRATGVDGCPIRPDCEPWHATPGAPCPYTGAPNTGGPCATPGGAP